jgi:hypothetical protein
MRLRWFLAIALFFGWLVWLTPALYPVPAGSVAMPAVSFRVLPDAPDPNRIFALVNQSRTAHGLLPLTADPYLAKVARQRAADMAARKYYAHRDQDGRIFSDLMAADGESITYGCENLDLEFTTTPVIYVDDWLGSAKGHRACLLNQRVTKAGYAVAKLELLQAGGQTMTAYVVVAIHTTEPTETQLAGTRTL